MRFPVVILLLILFSVTTSFSQQPVFSQYYAAGLFVNPSQAGLQKGFTLSSNYRSQWKTVDMPFQTFQMSCIYPITTPGIRKKHLGGVALSVVNDVAGPGKDLVSNGVYAAAAYNFQLNSSGNNILVVALQGGFHQTTIKTGNLLWSSQYVKDLGFDPSISSGENFNTRSMYPLLNIGMAWSFDRKKYSRTTFTTHHGVSVSNINRPNETIFSASPAPVPMRYQVHGGFSFVLNSDWEISPAYLLRMENDMMQTNTGAYAGYTLSTNNRTRQQTRLIVGAWYRLKDSFIATTGLQIGALTCGVSYDRNTASFGRYMGNAGAFEVSATFMMDKKRGMKRISTPLI